MSRVALLTITSGTMPQADPLAPLLCHLRERLGARINDVAVIPVDVTEPASGEAPTQQLWETLRQQAPLHYVGPRRFVLFGLAQMASFFGNPLDPQTPYTRMQTRIAQALLTARRFLSCQGPVIALTHGLGAQALSCYLYDAQQACAGRPVAGGVWRDAHALPESLGVATLNDDERSFLRGDSLQRWLSTGCNIPVFVAAGQGGPVRAIAPPSRGFRWLNLYDPDDVLSWPLQPLSSDYRALVEDRPLQAGEGLTHWITRHWSVDQPHNHWSDEAVLKELAGLLRAFL